MDIDKEIFNTSIVDLDKLLRYGFKKQNDKYCFSKKILDDTFRVEVFVDSKGILSSKVIDLDFNEEYLGINVNNSNSSFINKVKDEYKNILLDIKNRCFTEEYFIYGQTRRIAKYIFRKYGDNPEFLWKESPGYGVFRNKNNSKWYAIIMRIDQSKISNKSGILEIINVKLKQDMILYLLNKSGYYKAYHMNKKNWVTISLDDTLKDEEITSLIELSYNLVR